MSAEFWERGYRVAADLINTNQIAFTRTAIELAERHGQMRFGQLRAVPKGALHHYSPLAGELLLKQCQAAVEALIGRELLPAYAIARIYDRGSNLLRHRDRNACEVSVTLPIFADPEAPAWPIFVCDLFDNEVAVPLLPGAGLVYLGCEVPHWREPLDGNRQFQVFLHYVLKDGPNAGHAFDSRERLHIDAVLD